MFRADWLEGVHFTEHVYLKMHSMNVEWNKDVCKKEKALWV